MKQTPIWYFSVLSLVTFGIYPCFWSYYQWKHIKQRDQLDIIPAVRALFLPLWLYSLAKNIQESAVQHNLPKRYSSGVIAIVYFVLSFLHKLPDPYWLVSLLAFSVMIPVVRTNNLVLEKEIPSIEKNPKVGIVKWILIGLGFAFFLLALMGTFFPEI
jgi:ABC-type uncharacterized transport system permease subunit